MSVRRPPLIVTTVGAFVLGAGLLLAFDHPITLTLGVLGLVAFIVQGVFLIASPDYLADSPDDPPA